jgi:hypothetical protein
MQILLSNTHHYVTLCAKGQRFLEEQGFMDGWRLHSAGYAVRQYSRQGQILTHYMHKLLADHFLPPPQAGSRLFVRMKNGEKLDCRLDNLEWVTMKELRRQQHSGRYRGVSKDGSKYRAVIYDGKERIYLGLFNTPAEAAQAYDEESFRRFGITNSLNFKEVFMQGKEES